MTKRRIMKTTTCSGWGVLLAVTTIISITNSIPLNQFVPFGQSAGDSSFPPASSAASQVIAIPPTFPYFNGTYRGIIVSINGYLSFGIRSAYPSPVGFPFTHSDLLLICPFWANVDTTAGGVVYYRQSSGSTTIDNEIRRHFSNAASFTATWVLIATWHNVGYFSNHADKVNTFQAVIATNGRQSYTIFNYLDGGIQWSSADNTGGVNGIGVGGAQVGFNGGDGVHFYVQPEVINGLILQLDDNSNVCVPGKYVFRIDGENVQPGRCVDIESDSCTQEEYRDISPSLMISNRTSLVSVNLNTNAVSHHVVNCYSVLGIDYDLVGRMFYWSEVTFGTIHRVSFDNGHNGSAVETIIAGLSSPEQIAVDWVNRKLYFTDHGLRLIARSNLDGTNIELVVNVNILPQSIAVDPIHGTLFWINYDTPRRIEKMEMSGSRRRTIAQVSVVIPTGLTIDYDNNLLYWFDDHFNVLFECGLEGNSRVFKQPSNSISSPYAIEVFRSELYWSDQARSYVGVADQVAGIATRSINASLVKAGGIHVVHYSRQPGAVIPYIIRDSFIKRMNIPAPESFTLSVEFIAICINYTISWKFDGKQITNDSNHLITSNSVSSSHYMTSLTIMESSESKSGIYSVMVSSLHGSDRVNISVEIINDCTPSVIRSPFLLFPDYNAIRRMNLDGTDQRIAVLNVFNIFGLDFDILTNMLYWCELDLGDIYRASIDGDGRCRELIVSGLINPENVVIDWINRKLYWCDSGSDTIEYSNLDGSERTVLVNTGLDQPRGMAIDPLSGYIYWTDRGAVPKIEKMKLDGTERQVIVDSSLVWPNGLTIDYETSKLCWNDANHDRIECSNLDGSGRTTLYQNISQPYGITVYNDTLYWSDWTRRSVVTAAISGNDRILQRVTHGMRPAGIVVVHHSRQPGACGRRCSSSVLNPSMLVANYKSAEEHLLNGTNKQTIFVSSQYRLIGGMDVDITTNMVYWSNGRGEIYAFNYTDSSNTLIHDGLGLPKEITVNWITRKLYWLDYKNHRIECSDMDGNNRYVLINSTTRLLAMALDPRVNYIYWSHYHRITGTAVIEKMKLDGTNRHVIVSGMKRPNSITIDYTNSKLYWVDGHKIETSDLEGKGRLAVQPTGTSQATLAMYNNVLYWTEISSVHGCTTDGHYLGEIMRLRELRGICIKHKLRKPRACYATDEATEMQ